MALKSQRTRVCYAESGLRSDWFCRQAVMRSALLKKPGSTRFFRLFAGESQKNMKRLAVCIFPYINQFNEDINIQFTEDIKCVGYLSREEGLTTTARYLLGEKCGSV